MKIKKAPQELIDSLTSHGNCKYPIRELKPGEMFEVDVSKDLSVRNCLARLRREKIITDEVIVVRRLGNGKSAVIRLS